MSVLKQVTRISNDQIIGEGKIDSILLFDQEKWTLYPLGEVGLPQLNFDNMACDSRGQLWLYALLGETLCRFYGNTADVFRAGDRGLPSASLLVLGFATDAEGGLWAAMGTEGVYRFDGAIWQRITLPDSGISGHVTRVTTDHAGRIWLVVDNDDYTSFVLYDGKRWEEYARVPISYKTDVVQALTIDKDGMLWVGWAEQGLWVLDRAGGLWTKHTTENSALPDNHIRCIVVDKAGRVWVAGSGGITIFDGTESVCWRAIIPDVPHGPLGHEDVMQARARGDDRPYLFIGNYLVIDSQSRIWALSGNGVSVFSEA